MPFSFETFAWAVSALFQLLAVCAYLLSFPDVDGVDDHGVANHFIPWLIA